MVPPPAAAAESMAWFTAAVSMLLPSPVAQSGEHQKNRLRFRGDARRLREPWQPLRQCQYRHASGALFEMRP